MQSFSKLFLLSCLSILLSACGSDSENGMDGPSFDSTLEPSVYRNGEWNYSYISIEFYLYNSDNSTWESTVINTNPGTLTLLDNGVEGITTIKSLNRDSTADYALNGFVVGETLNIKGHIDGTTLALTMTSESGLTASLIGSAYDGDGITKYGDLWISLDYWYGVSDVSIEGATPGYDSYVDTIEFDSSVESTIIPLATEVNLGSGDSIYTNGSYIGDGSTYMTIFDNGSSYSTIEYDLTLTVSGNSLSGTMTLTDLDTFSDFEGYEVGDVFEVTGDIQGAVIYVTCKDPSNPDFEWKHIWGNRDISGVNPRQEALGEFTIIESEYGVTYRTPGTFGGENEVDLALQSSE